MSKVRQRTRPLSCSRHKRNGCRAQAALPTMMSGLDGCLHADVTWVGERAGEKKKRVFMSAFLLPNAGGGQEPDRVRHGRLVYTYKRAVCVYLSVCLLFIGHTTFVHFAALPPRAGEQEPSSRACRTTSQRKNRCADAFQKQNRTRAHAVVYVTAEIF